MLNSGIMKIKLKYIFYTAFVLTMLYPSSDCIAQETGNTDMKGVWSPWQVTLGIGTQMSGMQQGDEDILPGLTFGIAYLF
jgi:hypothetical protein